ncbi:hypothetical protein HQQ94_02125 [Shewanella sp. VB17]|uniref:hypothetical protein n=1 Tax=Shewanella sp. VB17 TaxID=2739432 RepID=UPI0015652592|nr:hypothetical protein [Shewanella sp. VB17]NRD72058.1 hypothetical protein [Shewanella sp. VB17]
MKIQFPKFLFVPVSSPKGIGEYMRSVIIAKKISEKWPNAIIEFILNKHTPYADDCPFPAHLLDDTPTKKIQEVNNIMSAYRPNLVLFDASGRKSQLKHAFELGAKVVFISQHKRKRSRGMKLARAKVTHRHWVVQPKFVLGDISWLDKKKLSFIQQPEPIFIGPIFSQPSPEGQRVLLDHHQLKSHEFIIFNSGSGGHKSSERLLADIFAEAAQENFHRTGIISLMVYGPNYPYSLPKMEGVVVIKQLDNPEFINLLDAAKFAVLSGGDTLLQAIALAKPTLAIPVSKDQPARIKACADLNLIHYSDCKIDAILTGINMMLQPQFTAKLTKNMHTIPSLNGLEICINEITKLLEE